MFVLSRVSVRSTSSIKVRSSTTSRCASKMPASFAPMASAMRSCISRICARVAMSAGLEAGDFAGDFVPRKCGARACLHPPCDRRKRCRARCLARRRRPGSVFRAEVAAALPDSSGENGVRPRAARGAGAAGSYIVLRPAPGIFLNLHQSGAGSDPRFPGSPCRRRALAGHAQFRALAGGEHHQAHDAFAIYLLAVLFHPDVGICGGCTPSQTWRRDARAGRAGSGW